MVTSQVELVPDHIEGGLPDDIELKPSDVAPNCMGAWCTWPIAEGTLYGPYCGEIISEKKLKTRDVDFRYAWEVYDLETFDLIHIIDATCPKRGNWMRYVNCARYLEEQNIVSQQQGSDVYYKAIKNIEPGEELLTWFEPRDRPKRRKRRKRSDMKKEEMEDKEAKTGEAEASTESAKKRRRKPKVFSDFLKTEEQVPRKRRSKSSEETIEKPAKVKKVRGSKSGGSLSRSVSSSSTVSSKENISSDAFEEVNSSHDESSQSCSKSPSNQIENEALNWTYPEKGEEFQFELTDDQIVSKGNIKTYKCNICSGLYKHHFSLKRHYLRNHINPRYLSKTDIANCLINLSQVMQAEKSVHDEEQDGKENDLNQSDGKSETAGKENEADIFEEDIDDGDDLNNVENDRSSDRGGKLKSDTSKKSHDENMEQDQQDSGSDDDEKASDDGVEDADAEKDVKETLDVVDGEMEKEKKNCIERQDDEIVCENGKGKTGDETDNPVTEDVQKGDENVLNGDESATKKHRAGLFRCFVCFKLFDTVAEIYKHTHDHPQSKYHMQHACDQCDMRFSYIQNLVRHQAVHADNDSGKVRVKKERKQKVTKVKQNLKAVVKKPVKVKTTIGIKRFKCALCEMKFGYLQNLVKHQSVHNKDGKKRPFACHYCGKDFPNLANMKKHVRFHLGYRINCRYCGDAHSSVGTLRKHIRIMHPDIYKAKQLDKIARDGVLRKPDKKNESDVAEEGKKVRRKKKEKDESSESQDKMVEGEQKDEGDVKMKKALLDEILSDNDNDVSFAVDEIDDGGSRFKFSCTVCKKRFSNYINMCRHRRKAHSSDKQKLDHLKQQVVEEDPVEVAKFYASVANNVAVNLSCYIDGGQESLENYVDHIKVDDYIPLAELQKEQEEPIDLTWDKYNFPNNFKPTKTISFLDIKKSFQICSVFDIQSPNYEMNSKPDAVSIDDKKKMEDATDQNKADDTLTESDENAAVGVKDRVKMSADSKEVVQSADEACVSGEDSMQFFAKEKIHNNSGSSDKLNIDGKFNEDDREEVDHCLDDGPANCVKSLDQVSDAEEPAKDSQVLQEVENETEESDSTGEALESKLSTNDKEKASESELHVCNSEIDSNSGQHKTEGTFPDNQSNCEIVDKSSLEIDKCPVTQLTKDLPCEDSPELDSCNKETILEDVATVATEEEKIETVTSEDKMEDQDKEKVDDKTPSFQNNADANNSKICDNQIEESIVEALGSEKSCKSSVGNVEEAEDHKDDDSRPVDKVEDAVTVQNKNDESKSDKTGVKPEMSSQKEIDQEEAKLNCEEKTDLKGKTENGIKEDSTEDEKLNSDYKEADQKNFEESSLGSVSSGECSNSGGIFNKLQLSSASASSASATTDDSQATKQTLPLENKYMCFEIQPQPYENPGKNFDEIAFGKHGKVETVCAICRKHFRDFECLIRHHWKKHPYATCSFIEVEQGHEIDSLYYWEPSNVGVLAVSGSGLDCATEREQFSCTRCGNTFKNISRLHVHIINCAPALPRLSPSKQEHRSKTPLKKKIRRNGEGIVSSDQNLKFKLADFAGYKASHFRMSEIKAKKSIFTGCKKREEAAIQESSEKVQKRNYDIGYKPQNHVRRRELADLCDTHQCKGCNLRFSSISLLERHVKNCSQKEKFKYLKPMKSGMMADPVAKSKHTCFYCNRNFTYPKSLINHFKDFCPVKKERIEKKSLSEEDKEQERKTVEYLKLQEEEKLRKEEENEDEKRKSGWPKGMKRKARRKGHAWTYIKRRKSTLTNSDPEMIDMEEDKRVELDEEDDVDVKDNEDFSPKEDKIADEDNDEFEGKLVIDEDAENDAEIKEKVKKRITTKQASGVKRTNSGKLESPIVNSELESGKGGEAKVGRKTPRKQTPTKRVIKSSSPGMGNSETPKKTEDDRNENKEKESTETAGSELETLLKTSTSKLKSITRITSVEKSGTNQIFHCSPTKPIVQREIITRGPYSKAASAKLSKSVKSPEKEKDKSGIASSLMKEDSSDSLEKSTELKTLLTSDVSVAEYRKEKLLDKSNEEEDLSSQNILGYSDGAKSDTEGDKKGKERKRSTSDTDKSATGGKNVVQSNTKSNSEQVLESSNNKTTGKGKEKEQLDGNLDSVVKGDGKVVRRRKKKCENVNSVELLEDSGKTKEEEGKQKAEEAKCSSAEVKAGGKTSGDEGKDKEVDASKETNVESEPPKKKRRKRREIDLQPVSQDGDENSGLGKRGRKKKLLDSYVTDFEEIDLRISAEIKKAQADKQSDSNSKDKPVKRRRSNKSKSVSESDLEECGKDKEKTNSKLRTALEQASEEGNQNGIPGEKKGKRKYVKVNRKDKNVTQLETSTKVSSPVGKDSTCVQIKSEKDSCVEMKEKPNKTEQKKMSKSNKSSSKSGPRKVLVSDDSKQKQSLKKLAEKKTSLTELKSKPIEWPGKKSSETPKQRENIDRQKVLKSPKKVVVLNVKNGRESSQKKLNLDISKSSSDKNSDFDQVQNMLHVDRLKSPEFIDEVSFQKEIQEKTSTAKLSAKKSEKSTENKVNQSKVTKKQNFEHGADDNESSVSDVSR